MTCNTKITGISHWEALQPTNLNIQQIWNISIHQTVIGAVISTTKVQKEDVTYENVEVLIKDAGLL